MPITQIIDQQRQGGGSGTPDPHASTHASGGTDALTPSAIGAQPAMANAATLLLIDQGLAITDEVEFAGVAITGASGIIHALAGVLTGGATTDDLPEGMTHLYYTSTRVNDAINALKGIASGLATLDINGKLPTAQLPPLAINDFFPAASEAGMLALTAQRGDWCLRTDTGNTYVLMTDDPTDLDNWQQVITTADVVSVNGQTGAVLLSTDHIGEGASNQYYTDVRADARITAQRGTANGIAPLDAASKVPSANLPAYPTAASLAEVNTGTDAAKYVTPATLHSANQLQRNVSIKVIADATDLATGDGKATWVIPANMAGMNLVAVGAHVFTASTSGLPTVQLARVRAGTPADMLSTRLTIDANETDTATATTAAVIDAANDDIAEADVIRIDVDVSGTGTKGLEVRMTFQSA